MENESYRYVGGSPTDLDGGRPIGPGEHTGPISVDPEEAPKNAQLLEEGQLIQIESDEEVSARRNSEKEQEQADARLTGDALDARAKELNIEGRSTMTADELRQAVTAAEAEQGKAGENS